MVQDGDNKNEQGKEEEYEEADEEIERPLGPVEAEPEDPYGPLYDPVDQAHNPHWFDPVFHRYNSYW